MTSEKTIYWMAVGILALSVTNGLMSQYRERAGRTVSKSIAIARQASKVAAGYANLGEPQADSADLKELVQARVRLARVRSDFGRHQAEMARLQAEAIRTQVLEHKIRAFVACPARNIVVNVPQPTQFFEDDTE
jgi:hypothetical protein